MKKYYFLILFFVLKISFLFAQNPYILKDENTETIRVFEVLPDENYTFEQVLQDSSLKFIENPALLSKEQVEKHDYFWIRFLIQNNFAYPKKIYLRTYPFFYTKIYAYNKEIEKWEGVESGLEVVDYQRKVGFKPVFIHSRKIDTVFCKVKVSPLRKHENNANLTIQIQKESYFTDREDYIFVIWIVSLVAMSLFFLYNLYVYFFFKDKTYLYYLVIVGGGILYISSSLSYVGLLLPFKIAATYTGTNQSFQFFDINLFVNQLSVCLILFGFVKFTNFYLEVYKNFHKWNRVLNYILYINITLILLTSFSTISGIYYCNTIFIASLYNGIILLLTILLLCLGVLSLLKRYKPARYFLIANGSALLTIIIITIYLINSPGDTYLNAALLTSIGLLSQSLTFAIALVARINLLKDELKEKQLQAQKLEAENENILARNKYIELENEYIIADMITAVNNETELREKIKVELNQKTELEQRIEVELNQKEELQAKLEANQRELTANSLYLYQKNELLTNLQKQIQNLSYKDSAIQNREEIREIKSVLQNDIQLDNDWDNFKRHFEQVHPSFFKELTEKYPTLTKNEIRLAAYYHLNMSVKEIATLLNIDPRSVHKAKSRLNKKMELIDNKN